MIHVQHIVDGIDNHSRPFSEGLFLRAEQIIPGGVNSPVRAFRAVGGNPVFISSGQGCWLYDVDGNRYVDLVCSWGPMIHGHAHPDVIAAVSTVAANGLSFGSPTEVEVQLAEKIHSLVPLSQKVRLVNSGTEATMSAIRLARAATGRDKIIKFAGCYHGHSDALLTQAGSGVAIFGLPSSPGVTGAVSQDTIVVSYNDISSVCDIFDRFPDQIAAIITEAAPGNMGVIPPHAGFNAALAKLCHNHGALLIFDEVMTGFRVSKSGWYGLDPIDVDLFTFGKVISGGLPAAAFGGKKEIMDLLAPLGPVYQAGTLSGNPVAVCAGLANLELACDKTYRDLDAHARIIGDLVHSALTKVGVAHQVQYAGNLFSVFFSDTPVHNYAQVQQTQFFRYAPFFHALLNQGVYVPPSPFEAWFVSTALNDEAFEIIESALVYAAKAAVEGR